jgi:hypothetical protein
MPTMTSANEWKIRLLKLREQYYSVRYPNAVHDHGIPVSKPYKDDTANGLQKCIKDWINFFGGDAQRVNTMGVQRNVRGQMKWTRSGGRRGSSDIHAIFLGRAIHIEVKVGKDELSEDQLKEKQRVESAGGIYYVAHNMESFVLFFDELTKKISSDAFSKRY